MGSGWPCKRRLPLSTRPRVPPFTESFSVAAPWMGVHRQRPLAHRCARGARRQRSVVSRAGASGDPQVQFRPAMGAPISCVPVGRRSAGDPDRDPERGGISTVLSQAGGRGAGGSARPGGERGGALMGKSSCEDRGITVGSSMACDDLQGAAALGTPFNIDIEQRSCVRRSAALVQFQGPSDSG